MVKHKIGFKQNEDKDDDDVGDVFTLGGGLALEDNDKADKDHELQHAVRSLYLVLRRKTFKDYGPACISKGVKMMKTLYPDGIRVDQYLDAFVLARMLDKIVRVADGEGDKSDAWGDISGYGIRRLTEEEDD